MINLLRSEWIKLRTVRINLVIAILALAIPLVVVVLVATLSGNVRQGGEDLVGLVTILMVLTALLLGTIGALNLTSEYSHGTIRTTFAAVPQRTSVLSAKAIVTLVTTMLFAAVIELITYAVGAAILSARDAEVELSGTDKTAMVGAVVLCGMLAWLGYGLGLLIRNSAATVAILILWPLLLENIARAILSAAGIKNQTPWLPYQSAITMANPDIEAGEPGRVRAGLLLGAVVIVIIVIGTIVNERRDA